MFFINSWNLNRHFLANDLQIINFTGVLINSIFSINFQLYSTQKIKTGHWSTSKMFWKSIHNCFSYILGIINLLKDPTLFKFPVALKKNWVSKIMINHSIHSSFNHPITFTRFFFFFTVRIFFPFLLKDGSVFNSYMVSWILFIFNEKNVLKVIRLLRILVELYWNACWCLDKCSLVEFSIVVKICCVFVFQV